MNSLALVMAAVLSAPLAGAPDNVAKLSPLADEAMGRFGLVEPQTLLLSPDKPATVKAAPDRPNLRYALAQFGPSTTTRTIVLAVDESNPDAPAVWIDANADGDLTNDPTAAWTFVKMASGQPGNTAREALVKLTAPAPLSGRTLRIYRFTPAEASARKLPPDAIYCQIAAGCQGEAVIGGRKMAAVLLDRVSLLDFTYPYPDGRTDGLVMLLDLNGDSSFGADERFALDKPIKVGDVEYEVGAITADGAQVEFRKYNRAARRAGPPQVGDTALAFTAPGLDGKPVKFPDDYKGKIVLLDFWATWCKPCVAEIPNVKKAYEKYNKKGFEVLGVSFDNAGMTAQLKKFTQDKGMPWRQVYEGKFWDTQVGKQWKIAGIPAMFLVDGDTGKILAAGEALRGEGMDPAIGLELKNKFERPKE